MLTTVLLIRHGQTDWNIAGRWQGHIDIPLNETGVHQSKLLAKRLATWPIEAIYTSDLKRAIQTADQIGIELGIRPIKDRAFRERNGGSFQGLTGQELKNNYGEEWRRVRQDGWAPPNGESNKEVSTRMVSAFQKVVQSHLGSTIAIVSHGGALKLLISHILGLPAGQPAPIRIGENTGLSIIETNQQSSTLTLLNDDCHLNFRREMEDLGKVRASDPE